MNIKNILFIGGIYMDPEVIKAALDSFENDDFLQSKDLLRG
jgi:hypothetical protein